MLKASPISYQGNKKFSVKCSLLGVLNYVRIEPTIKAQSMP